MWVARCAGARDRAARDAAQSAAQPPARHDHAHHQPSMLDDLRAKMASLGLQPDPAQAPAIAPRVVYLWPENVRTWAHFLDLRTQWRTDGGIPVGLDYAGCRAHLRAVRSGSAGTWHGIRACEAGYIAGWHHGAWHGP